MGESNSGVLTPSSAAWRWYTVRASPRFFAQRCRRWSAGRDGRSKSRAFIAELEPARDAPLNPPLEAALQSQPITAACRISGVRSGSLLQQISSTGVARTQRGAALHRPLAAAAASRVVGCAERAGFAAPAHLLGAAVVVGGRLGVRVGLRDARVDQQGRPADGPGWSHHWGHT